MIKNYSLINSLYLTKVVEKLPKFISRKIHKIFKIYFVPTKISVLPNFNYPISHNCNYQNELIKNFKNTQKQNSFMTYPDLINLISSLYSKNDEFNFLDYGSENVDFYLKLKLMFPKVNYFIFNQKNIMDNLKIIKEENNFKNFNLIYNEKQLSENQYDFINLGSVIQYIKDYEALILDLMNISKKHIFFSGTHFYESAHESKNMIVKQVNILPRTFYLYFFNKDIFKSIFLEHNFKIKLENKNLTDNINYKNFKSENFSSIDYLDILFEKN